MERRPPNPQVTVPREPWWEMCVARAKAFLPSYGGRTPPHEIPGRRISGDVNTVARQYMHEVAFCIAAGLDPHKEIDWTWGPDAGHDVTWGRLTIDVKARLAPRDPFEPDLLIHPQQTEYIRRSEVDILMLQMPLSEDPMADPFTVELIGWVPRWLFLAQHLTADGSDGLDKGSMVYEFDWLEWPRRLRLACFPEWWETGGRPPGAAPAQEREEGP